MPDVSRAEYDAALTRVREARWADAEYEGDMSLSERLTLAALGLDEPPTEEERFDAPGCQMCGVAEDDPCDCFDPQGDERADLDLMSTWEHEENVVSDAKATYENLPPEAVAAAASFIRGLLYNLDDQPCDEAQAARNCATHILHAAGWVPPSEPPKASPTRERDEYRRVIRSALDVMEGLTDAELGPGGGARRAYAGLWHAYYAVPAGMPTGGSGVDGGTP